LDSMCCALMRADHTLPEGEGSSIMMAMRRDSERMIRLRQQYPLDIDNMLLGPS
jgi:hypothetical protein